MWYNTQILLRKKPEEHEFRLTFRLMSRQYNQPYELDLLNGELEKRMQEKEMNQSGGTMQKFDQRTMLINRFYSNSGCYAELPFKSK